MSRQNNSRRRGQIVPRSNGKFLLRVELGVMPTAGGKSKRVIRSETFAGTRAEAERALTAKLAKLDLGETPKPTRSTVSEAANAWLAGRVGISARTRYNYQSRIDAYVRPSLGFYKLRALSREMIQAWVASLATRYSPSTVRQAFVTLSQIIDVGVRDGALPSNPCRYVELPKITRHGTPPILTVEQMGTLFPKIIGEKHGPLFVIMLLSGVRPQEALALTWRNVTTLYDDATHTAYPALAITQALTMAERTRWVVGPVKTPSSRRLIPLPASADVVLRIQRERVKACGPDDFVFAHDVGGHQNPDTIYEAWQRTLKRHGLPAVKLYATRHSSVTALLAGGIHPKVVAERHGHSSTAVTLEVYSHVLPSMQAGALRALPDSFGAFANLETR